MSECDVAALTNAGGRPAWVSPELFPYESHFIDVDGCRVHYVDEGEGPVLLLLHGNPTWSFLYRHLIGRLRRRFRCIALDFPGFGLSRARPGYGFTPAEHASVVERFVAELALASYTPVVHDWGGPIGLAVASRHPDRIRAVVGVTRFGLDPNEDGSTRLRLSHEAFGHLDPETERNYGLGWQDLLGVRLKAYLEEGVRYGLGHPPPSSAPSFQREVLA